MRACVVGGCGFIGSHLTEKLLGLGNEVTVLDDLSAGKIENLKDAQKAELLIGSVTDRPYVMDVTQNIDVIYHLATLCLVKGLADPADMYMVNDYGTFNICLAAKKHGCKIVYVGTSEEYGPQTDFPIKESNPLNPVSIYGQTKIVAESYVRFFHKIYHVPAVCIRPFNTFGPRQREDGYAGVITSFSKKILANDNPVIHGDGLQTRDFSYIDDIVEGIVLMSQLEQGEIVNLGSGKEVSVARLAWLINNIQGKHVEPVYGEARVNDVRRLVADTSYARRYGYQNQTSLEEGLRKYLRWLNR